MDNQHQGSTMAANQLLFDYTLPPGVLVTYLRLLSLAGGGAAPQTGPLEFSRQVAPVLGIKASQAHTHLRALRMAKLLSWTQDVDGRYTFFFNIPEIHESGNLSPVVVGDVEINFKNKISTHQQQQGTSDDPSTGAKAGKPAGGMAPRAERSRRTAVPPGIALAQEMEAIMQDADGAEVMGWLRKAGVWTDRAIQITRQVLENERLDMAYLPGRADVLGWIAFCFAFQRKNEIEKPAQLLAANLLNNRCCPADLRPPRICAACNFEEGYCQCHGEPRYRFPAEFIDYAIRVSYDLYAETFWGVCKGCRGFPCQCPDVDLEEEDD